MSTLAVNNSTYTPTKIIDINKTENRISTLTGSLLVVASLITIIGGIALANLALAILGTIALTITLVLAFSVKKIDPPKFQTITGGEPFYIAPAPVYPVIIPERSPLASDPKEENDRDLSILVEHPKGELQEVSDALLQELDPILAPIAPIETDEPPVSLIANLGQQTLPTPQAPQTPPPVKLEASPAIEKKPAWYSFARTKKD